MNNIYCNILSFNEQSLFKRPLFIYEKKNNCYKKYKQSIFHNNKGSLIKIAVLISMKN